MDTIDLVQVVSALRAQLADAVTAAKGQEIQFPVGEIQLEFQVGVTKDVNAKGGVNFHIFELGVGGDYSKESVQTVTIHLEAPVDDRGERVKIGEELPGEP
jgi:hypothetical protein